MPEGDTIWRTAAALRNRLDGRLIRAARPQRSLGRLAGRRVVAVEPVGKHLFIRFDNGLSLHSHMRMDGAWHLYAPGERWRKPEHLARAVLETDDTVAVCFLAPVVELVAGDGAVAHLGPDVLSPEFDVDQAVRRAPLPALRHAGLGPLAGCAGPSHLLVHALPGAGAHPLYRRPQRLLIRSTACLPRLPR